MHAESVIIVQTFGSAAPRADPVEKQTRSGEYMCAAPEGQIDFEAKTL